jgi:hypothetical protein
MKCLLLLSLVSACSSSSLTAAPLKKGMNEQQVIQAYNTQLPDRVVERTCGNETPAPFPCKIYIYEGTLQRGHPKLSVVFENFGGRWLVSQWL